MVLEREEAGGFSVTVRDLPGCVSQGETQAEALANVREAIEGYIEGLKADHAPKVANCGPESDWIQTHSNGASGRRGLGEATQDLRSRCGGQRAPLGLRHPRTLTTDSDGKDNDEPTPSRARPALPMTGRG